MSKPAIIIDNISKAYRIGLKEKANQSFREAFTGALAAPFRRLRGLGAEAGSGDDTFWALKDVSFEVQPGEVVGIIGRNGAGKSTLLKVLSRITEPTSGRAVLRGRVASLLEVGTGFHPELTGRENIYLNGAILGMKRAEIARKFDEIVAFAEIDKFLDTPVKRYSSGMYVRLAFAVAAHLEPEILIVDEVLAVGDAEFQKKCLGKMQEVSKGQGRTVLFVSHNMAAVRQLCGHAVWLKGGRLLKGGSAAQLASEYLSDGHLQAAEHRWADAEMPGRSNGCALRAVRVVDSEGKLRTAFESDGALWIEVEYEILSSASNIRISIQLTSLQEGVVAFTSVDHTREHSANRRNPGRHISRCIIPPDMLNQGRYAVTASADVPFVHVVFHEEAVVRFEVTQTAGFRGSLPERWPGVLCPKLEWKSMCVDRCSE